MADWIPSSKPDWWSTVSTFGKSPVGFILGAVLGTALDGLQTVWETLVTAVFAVFVGEEAGSTEGTWGLVDIPIVTLGLVMDAGSIVASSTVSFLTETVVGSVVDFALLFGPLSPLILTIEAALAIAVVFVVFRTLVRVGIDALPGGGGLLS